MHANRAGPCVYGSTAIIAHDPMGCWWQMDANSRSSCGRYVAQARAGVICSTVDSTVDSTMRTSDAAAHRLVPQRLAQAWVTSQHCAMSLQQQGQQGLCECCMDRGVGQEDKGSSVFRHRQPVGLACMQRIQQLACMQRIQQLMCMQRIQQLVGAAISAPLP